MDRLKQLWSDLWSDQRRSDPTRFAIGFAGLIALGALVLRLPISAADESIGWIDALFTATSAVCVTGLSTIDVGADLSRFGQVVLMTLIQIGALGITTFSAFVLLAAGRASLSHQLGAQDQWAAVRTKPLHLLTWVLGITAFLEIMGAMILTLSLDEGTPGFSAAFHSVSAFCNAGFSLYPDSLAGFRDQVGVQFTVMGLIALGGLGFIVLRQLTLSGADFLLRRRWRLFLHTKIVLTATLVLWIVGALSYLCLEWDSTLQELTLFEKITASMFQSVTTRTAGFNTLDYSSMREITLFFTIVLMWIGGAPGGVAGGIKVTTVVVILATVRARLRNAEEVWLFKRTIPREIVQRAFQLAALSLLALAVVVGVLLLTEESLPLIEGRRDHFLMLTFEAVSAFATVGLSTGITPDLSAGGKLILTVAMFVGRLGPLVFTLAIFRPSRRLPFEYPHEKIAIG